MKLGPRCRYSDRIVRLVAGVSLMLCALQQPAKTENAEAPRLTTHQSLVEDVLRSSSLKIDDVQAVFAFVFNSLPDRVKVYPTENYYYFNFLNNGVRYSGNIRLDIKDRDAGKVHFAYFEDLAEWREEPTTKYRVFDASAGVTVKKIERFLYRIAHGGKVVQFELNDLSNVTPPAGIIGSDEVYIGPVFDDSAIRFFLIYNSRLKIFHYVLDETVRMTESLLWTHETDRILIGKRSGFAFYHDPRRDRKILIGVFEANARVNNAFDGPFDQLPDNFIEDDKLQKAILDADPEMAGKIDRFGGLINGSGRYIIAPYKYYRSEEDLLAFHRCATDRRIPETDYYGCFAMDWNEPRELVAVKKLNARSVERQKKKGRGATR